MSFANERFTCGVLARPLLFSFSVYYGKSILSVSLNLVTGDFFMSNLLISAFSFKEIFGNITSKWYLYLALGVCAVLLVLYFVFYCKGGSRLKLTETQRICHIAVFTAICVAVNVFSFSPSSSITVSLLATVCTLAGFLYGPKDAFIIGFTGDLIGAIICPFGSYNPLIGLASGLMGMIPAMVFSRSGNVYMKVAVSTLLTLGICTCGLNTFGLWLFYGLGKKTFYAYLFARLPFQIIVALGNAVLSAVLIRLLVKILPEDKLDL